MKTIAQIQNETRVSLQAVAGALKKAGYSQRPKGDYHTFGFQVMQAGDSVLVSAEGVASLLGRDWERRAKHSAAWRLATWAELLSQAGFTAVLSQHKDYNGRPETRLLVIPAHGDTEAVRSKQISPDALKAQAIETEKARERARLWDEGVVIESQILAKLEHFDALKKQYEALASEGKPWPTLSLTSVALGSDSTIVDKKEAEG